MPDPIRLLQVDASSIEDHSRLGPDDHCYYLFEYTSGVTWSFSKTNNLISNLKKKPSVSSASELYWKGQAIVQAAAALRRHSTLLH